MPCGGGASRTYPVPMRQGTRKCSPHNGKPASNTYALDRLPHCEVPIHVVAFSQDLQTPPSRGRVVAEAAKHGHFHLLEGLGHFSLFGHKPDVVNACIRGIIDSYDRGSSGN